jgi:ACR3 family arsenite transporter
MDSGPWLHTAAMLLSALAGLAFGAVFDLSSAEVLIEVFLILMLYAVFSAVDGGDLRKSFANARFSVTALAINFVFTPVLAWAMGQLLYDDSDMRIGLFLLLIMPCTDWYLVFTRLAGGNVALGSSILPMNLVIQVVMMPVYLMIFYGSDVDFDMADMLLQAAYMVVIPLVAVLVVKWLSKRSGSVQNFDAWVIAKSDLLQLFFLCLAIFAMFASSAETVFDNAGLVASLIVPMLAFFLIDYAVASAASRAERMPYGDATALIFTTMARNEPLALAIAAAVFADSPLILVALAVGPLIELPVLSLVASARAKNGGKIENDAGTASD